MNHSDLPRSFREKCEWYASEWRRKLDIEIDQYLSSRVLAESLTILVFKPSDMPASNDVIDYLENAEDWLGVIIHYHPTMILYNPLMTSERVESTIMHELAHIILDHPMGKLYLAPNGLYKRNFESQIELEANYLGSCLQIPRRGLQLSLQRNLSKQEIAERFRASLEMVQWRINAVIH